MTVTNPPLGLLGVLLVSQPSVHVPDTHTEDGREHQVCLRRSWEGEGGGGRPTAVVTSTAPAALRDFPSLSGCSETRASPFCRGAEERRARVKMRPNSPNASSHQEERGRCWLILSASHGDRVGQPCVLISQPAFQATSSNAANPQRPLRPARHRSPSKFLKAPRVKGHFLFVHQTVLNTPPRCFYGTALLNSNF